MMISRTSARALLASTLLLTAGAAALAQNSEPRDIQGDFDRPLGEGNAQGGVRARTIMKLSQTEQDGTSYALTIEDGKKSATIDGQPIPRERIREKGNKVEILDPAGNVLTTFNVGQIRMGEPMQWGGGPIPNGNRAARIAPANPDLFRVAPGLNNDQPPVMLGITMSAQDGGVVIDRVVPNLPAEKAGLKEGDIILKFDGQAVTTPEALRAAMKDKKAGDAINIRVKRDDKELDLKADLVPFDAKELGVNEQAAMVVRPFMDEAERSMEEAKRAVEEALEKVKGIDTEKIRKDIEEQLTKALASMDKAQAGAREQGQRWVEMLNRGPGTRMFMGGDGDAQQMFVMPDGADNQQLHDMIQEQLRRFQEENRQFQRMPDQDAQAEKFLNNNRRNPDDAARSMDRISEQLEKMMDRLDRLEKRLDESAKKP